jgi:hypothetical protein
MTNRIDGNGLKEESPAMISTQSVDRGPNNVSLDDGGRRGSSAFSRLTSWWYVEIIAMTLSLTSLAAVIGMLAYMNNKPLDAFSVDISINTVIAILITVMRTSMMVGVGSCIAQSGWLYFKNGPRTITDLQAFDEATRGIKGSIKLLFSIGWGLPAIGAIVTILSLALDPFAQQVVKVVSNSVSLDDRKAIINYAHSYNGSATTNIFGLIDGIV